MNEKKMRFDPEAYKCIPFLEGLNKCKTNEELVRYVDSIVDEFRSSENDPNTIGTGVFFTGQAYVNNGEYKDFIKPQMKILNASLGYAYHIYDREYLYSFAYGIRRLNLPNDTNLLPYVMLFLDSYFGFPKDNVDRRDDILYDYALLHAEEFYKKHNIPIDEKMGAVDQMQLTGDFPLSALKGTNSAQCMERSALAQNIMKMCGYNSSIMYGDCESRGFTEGHSWNAIYDKDGNVMIIDYSNTIFVYKDGQFIRRNPFASEFTSEEFKSKEGILETRDYHFENGRKILENKNRTYAVGKRLTKNSDKSQEDKSI